MRRRIFLIIACLIYGMYNMGAGEAVLPKSDEVRAMYLATGHIFNQAKIVEFEQILDTTSANGVVIDVKDSNAVPQEYLASLVARFHRRGAYTIARIVTFQDSYFARQNPAIAIRKASTEAFWYNGRASWRRYWLDPSSSLAQQYNIRVALQRVLMRFNLITSDSLPMAICGIYAILFLAVCTLPRGR